MPGSWQLTEAGSRGRPTTGQNQVKTRNDGCDGTVDSNENHTGPVSVVFSTGLPASLNCWLPACSSTLVFPTASDQETINVSAVGDTGPGAGGCRKNP